MAFIFDFLRHIFGHHEEERRDDTRRTTNANRNPYDRYREVPNYRDTSPRTSAPPPSTTTTYSISQSNAQTTTRIQSQSYLNSSNLPRTSSTPSVPTRVITETSSILASSPKPASSKPSSSLSGHPPSSPWPASSSSSSSSSSSLATPLSAPKLPPFSTKPTLSLAPSDPADHQTTTKYIWVEKGTSPIYVIPENIGGLITKDIVPEVLNKPLSPSTYKDYFGALLYAEDYYLEKWDGFEMENVTLKLQTAAVYNRRGKSKNLYENEDDEKDDKIFVAFEIDSIPERRPFLLSRDFAYVRPSGRKVEPFQGVIYRVVKSNLVLVEFGEDFHSQHYSACKYNVKFSFNRVCLKRAYQAIVAASDPSFRNFLFPDCPPQNSRVPLQHLFVNHRLDKEQVSAVRLNISLQGPPPYLVEGPLSVGKTKQLSRTGVIVQEAVLQIYRTSSSYRILICAPLNSTCDVLMRNLKKEIPESEMFRANAAFRELDGVPSDIISSCLYEGECFSCPSLQELRDFRVILSTFMSSFRLHSEGIIAGHFSHIFLVDASSATEPETMVALANLANEKTVVVITGAPKNHSGWVRSNIARRNGLLCSYFDRLRESRLYQSLDSKFMMQLEGAAKIG